MDNIQNIMAPFLSLCGDVNQKYEFYWGVVGDCDNRTCDYLHSLELDQLGYHERARLATKEVENRKERREAKDIVQLLQPLKEYLDTGEGRKAYHALQQVLGQTRKVEKHHENRSYRKRAKG